MVTSRDCVFNDEWPLAIELPLHTTSHPCVIESSADDAGIKEELPILKFGSGLDANMGDNPYCQLWF